MVELRLSKIGRRLAQDVVGLAQLAVFALELLHARALVGRQTGALARITPAWRTQLLSVSGVQPIFAAIDVFDIHCVG